ncbi:Adenylylsulfatase HINT1 [Linum grandiflorum]
MSENCRSRVSVLSSHFTPMASEKDAALAAAATPAPSDTPTIFDKIINKEIPANVVYEDDKVLAFRDINPQAPTHIVIIPKVKDGLSGLSKAEERHCEILGRLMYSAKVIAKQEGLEDGFRIVINDGPKGCKFLFSPSLTRSNGSNCMHIHQLIQSRSLSEV